MHILFFSHYYYPEVNAPATRTHEHCKRWAAAGHSITVVTCAPNCPTGIVYAGYKNLWRHAETIDGVNVIRVWTIIEPNKGLFLRITNYLSYMVIALMQMVSTSEDFDLVIATSPQFFCGWAGAIYSWIHKKKFVLEIRDIWPESIVAVGAMRKSPLIWLLKKMEIGMYHFADHIITAGNGYRENIIHKGIDPAKISVIVNGVDLESFRKKTVTVDYRKKYAVPGAFVCAYIGTVGMAHGLEVMLDAAKLNSDSPDGHGQELEFWIAGDGAMRDRLEKEQIKRGLKNVRVLGLVPKCDLPDLISSCDACLVHLRAKELFETVIPSKIFEIMALEVPIIMGVKGEALRFVLDAGGGVAMEPDNAESLLECISKIRAHKGNFKARKYVENFFNREILAAKMLQTLTEIAKPLLYDQANN